MNMEVNKDINYRRCVIVYVYVYACLSTYVYTNRKRSDCVYIDTYYGLRDFEFTGFRVWNFLRIGTL